MSLIEEDANAHVALEIGDNECLCETVAEEGGGNFFSFNNPIDRRRSRLT